MALRERRLADRVLGFPRREATIAEALSVGALDEGTLDLSRVAEADLIVLAPTVLTIPRLVEAIMPYLEAGAIVTDVGSTKAKLMLQLEAMVPPEVELIGGHPMAGSEQGGVLAGRADLFEGAIWVVTPSPRTRPENLQRLTSLIRQLGANPIEMDAEAHDAAVARISHLPHVAAAALATAALAEGADETLLRLLVAGGFKSTTRIAASPPEVWRDICLTNREAILAALAAFEVDLSRFRSALEAADGQSLSECFARGKRARERMVPPDVTA
jgi:prephenate dehydrogenase